MHLYLARHGEAVRATIDPGLTDEGADDVRRMGDHLVRVAQPLEILHSVKTRARETAAILAEKLGAPVAETRGLLPGDPVEEVAEKLTFAPDDTLVVSHLPFLDRLITALVFPDGGGDRIVMTPGSVIALRRSDLRPGYASWWISWFLTPEVMP